jgi:hypothetical protein
MRVTTTSVRVPAQEKSGAKGKITNKLNKYSCLHDDVGCLKSCFGGLGSTVDGVTLSSRKNWEATKSGNLADTSGNQAHGEFRIA